MQAHEDIWLYLEGREKGGDGGAPHQRGGAVKVTIVTPDLAPVCKKIILVFSFAVSRGPDALGDMRSLQGICWDTSPS